MKAKLRSKAGESIAETLLALLISALALTMLAGAISTAASLVTKSNRQMAKYYSVDEKLVERSVTSDEEGIYSYTAGNTVEITDPDDDTRSQPFPEVKGYANNAFSGIPVMAYSIK